MKAKVIEDADVVTSVLVCDPGDEAVTALTQFARAERPVPHAAGSENLPARIMPERPGRQDVPHA